MLKEAAKKYYLEGDYNCAETLLLAANECYQLGLDPKTCYRLMSAFGGGMGCGVVCGALAGAIAALGEATVQERAHATKGFRTTCTNCVRDFNQTLGGTDCAKIKPIHFSKETRCLNTVLLACEVLERQMEAAKANKV